MKKLTENLSADMASLKEEKNSLQQQLEKPSEDKKEFKESLEM